LNDAGDCTQKRGTESQSDAGCDAPGPVADV